MAPTKRQAWRLAAARFPGALLVLLAAACLVPAQVGHGASRDPLPPIISTKDPEVVPASFQQSAQPPDSAKPAELLAPAVSAKEPSPLLRERPLPIDLPTALRLANVEPLEIALAQQRLATAAAQLARANILWLPTIYVGGEYFRHDGRTQDSSGDIINNSHSSMMAGAGPSMVFATTDALFAPLAARQVVAARQASVQAAANDSLLAVAEAYFNVQQARGELAGAEDAVVRAAELVRRADQLAGEIAPPSEANRTRAELARRRQAVQQARERWRTASAELARLLRLDPAALVDPQEPPQLQVAIVPLDKTVDDLIEIALTNRPELAASQALVRAALERLRQEKMRPFLPSILLRPASTDITGTLAGGAFGGGINQSVNNFGSRFDMDLQVVWEFQNLGFGNRARIAEQRAEQRAAVLESFRVQDRIASEVVQAHAQLVSALERLKDSEQELKEALDTVLKSFEGLTTKKAGNIVVLIVRPQEAVAAVQALAAAYNDYYDTIADFNRAQFRLYRALGRPAQFFLDPNKACGDNTPTPAPPPHR